MTIYLDCNATTPIDPNVLKSMASWHGDQFGNASSRDHELGWNASVAVEEARSQIAEMSEVGARKVCFVSGATEALNTVIRGYVGFRGWSDKAIVVCETEHSMPCSRLAATCVELPVSGWKWWVSTDWGMLTVGN